MGYRGSLPKLVPLPSAWQAVVDRLGAEFEDGDDPAPWHDISPELTWINGPEDGASVVRREKLAERARLAILHGLLTGDLLARWEDEPARVVPAWAWAAAEKQKSLFSTGKLHLHVRLPPEWDERSGKEVSLQSDVFDAWLEGGAHEATRDLPLLPQAHDIAKRPGTTARKPANVSFIPLAEALSWLAFKFAVPPDRLESALANDDFGGDAEQLLGDALQRIIAAGMGGQISMRARFSNNGTADDERETKGIEAVALHDFAALGFDLKSLVRGEGLAWQQDQQCAAAYRNVMVSRSDLLNHLAPRINKPDGFSAGRSRPRLPESKLATWWNDLPEDERSKSHSDIAARCEAAFPDHHISRARIRELAPDRKRGPKPAPE